MGECWQRPAIGESLPAGTESNSAVSDCVLDLSNMQPFCEQYSTVLIESRLTDPIGCLFKPAGEDPP